MSLPVLYEDNHIIIVNKRPGDIVQGDKTGDQPLSEIVKAYIKDKYNKPGDVFLGVVHRIDRPVSGALIFARTSKALSRLNKMLKNREIRKVYWTVVSRQSAVGSRQSTVGSQQSAVSSRQLAVNSRQSAVGSQQSAVDSQKGNNGWKNGKEWQNLVHYLKRNQKQNKSYAFEKPAEGRSRAEMKFRKIAEGDRYDLMEIELITGRHHQIRAQFSAIGYPIRGDLKYGYARSNPNGSIHLHARMIEFIHPVSKKPLKITALPPDDKLWNYFVEVLGH